MGQRPGRERPRREGPSSRWFRGSRRSSGPSAPPPPPALTSGLPAAAAAAAASVQTLLPSVDRRARGCGTVPLRGVFFLVTSTQRPHRPVVLRTRERETSPWPERPFLVRKERDDRARLFPKRTSPFPQRLGPNVSRSLASVRGEQPEGLVRRQQKHNPGCDFERCWKDRGVNDCSTPWLRPEISAQTSPQCYRWLPLASTGGREASMGGCQLRWFRPWVHLRASTVNKPARKPASPR